MLKYSPRAEEQGKVPVVSSGGLLPANEWRAIGAGKMERSLALFICICDPHCNNTRLVENRHEGATC